MLNGLLRRAPNNSAHQDKQSASHRTGASALRVDAEFLKKRLEGVTKTGPVAGRVDPLRRLGNAWERVPDRLVYGAAANNRVPIPSAT